MASKYRGLLAVMTVLAVAVGFQGQAEAKSKKTPVRTFFNEDGTRADGHVTGSAELKRKKEGIRIEVNTTELGAGYAYTNWWVIFNNPEHGDVLRSLSKKKMYGSPNSNPSPELGADKENHTSWERYYQVSDCSSSLRNDWYSGI